MSTQSLPRVWVVVVLGLAIMGKAAPARGNAALDPVADIHNVYAWMNVDGTAVNLVMTVSPFDTRQPMFHSGILYVFHVATHSRTTPTRDGPKTQVICEFQTRVDLECWVGARYVRGNPLPRFSEWGFTSADGSIRVYATRRSDPFFHDLDGFEEAAPLLAQLSEARTNPRECPALPVAEGAEVLRRLTASPFNDRYLHEGTLALVLQVRDGLLGASADFPVLSVWGSTHLRP